jgi:hypothetical protein
MRKGYMKTVAEANGTCGRSSWMPLLLRVVEQCRNRRESLLIFSAAAQHQSSIDG